MVDAKLTPGGGITTLSAPGWNAQKWFCDYLPVTKAPKVKFFVDGSEYCWDLYTSLQGAKSKVYLTGLHFMADFALKRVPGSTGNSSYALSNVLASLAKKGVAIYLLVNKFWRINDSFVFQPGYQRVIMWQGNLKNYQPETVKLFSSLASYPSSVRCRADVHPGFLMSTHHQKTVIIDDTLCYLGGIDLTAVDGDRWDTKDHALEESADKSVRKWDLTENNWHDVHMRLEGDAVRYVIDNFHARWNHGDLYQYDPDKLLVSQVDKVELPPVSLTSTPQYLRQYEFKGEIPTLGIHGIHSRKTEAGIKTFSTSKSSLIQIVRSMPWKSWSSQKPSWNLSGERWERSAKDAYLIGIRAAEQSIYLENQWIADEDIWASLAQAARRNKDNPDFRIVLVLPYAPLAAAGMGRNQDLWLSDEGAEVLRESGSDPERFGVFSLVNRNRIPEELQALRDEEKDPVYQIYVHSKILIVDDCWALIGSANAGGISLEGLADPTTAITKVFGNPADSGASPDSEIAAIVLDRTFATQLRNRIWKEHLEVGSDTSFVDGVRLFHQKAALNTQRVVYYPKYGQMVDPGWLPNVGSGSAPTSAVDTIIGLRKVAYVRSCAKIVSLQAGMGNSFSVPNAEKEPSEYGFMAEVPDLGQEYKAWFHWMLRDPYDDPMDLPSWSSGVVEDSYFVDDECSYLDTAQLNAVKSVNVADGWSIQCQVQLRYVEDGYDDSTSTDTITLQHPLTMVF